MKDSIASDGSNWVSRRDEFRKGVVALAAKEGIPPMAVAERLIANAQSEVEHDKIVSAIRDCFRGFEWDIALIKELPAGRLRSGIINGLASGLERQDRDLVGLKTLYDAVPVGAARADVAAAGARLTVELKGLPAGLEYIAGLEMPEERFAAFREINTKENFGDSGDQKEIQEKCDAIVETFPPRQRAIYRYLRGKGR